MIKANVSKDNDKQTIIANGSILDFVGDFSVILSGIHTQLGATNPEAAELFKQAIQKIVADDNGPCWTQRGSQTGIAIDLPGDPNEP